MQRGMRRRRKSCSPILDRTERRIWSDLSDNFQTSGSQYWLYWWYNNVKGGIQDLLFGSADTITGMTEFLNVITMVLIAFLDLPDCKSVYDRHNYLHLCLETDQGQSEF
jgi:hypothetical protein